MAIVINDTVLPDIPADVLSTYPYAVIVKSTIGDISVYSLGVSNSSVVHLTASASGVGETENSEFLYSAGAGRYYYTQDGATWIYEGAETAAGDFVFQHGLVGEITNTLIWTNHDIYEVTAFNPDTGEYTIGGVWFAKSVDGSDGEVIATHFYYNTVLLPEIPSEVLKTHPYCWIRTNTQTGYYDLLMSSSPWWKSDPTTITTATYADGIQWYRVLISGSGYDWIFYQSWTESGDFVVDVDRTILWSNHNIPVGSVSASEIYFNGSTPIPVVESYDIRRDTLVGIANQVRRICGTSEGLTPIRMSEKLANLNIDLMETYVTSTTEDQVIYPDEGYYGFSKITVGGVDFSGSGGSGGGSIEDQYTRLEDAALTYEETIVEVPTGKYKFGSLTAYAYPVTYPYQYIGKAGDGSYYVVQTNVPLTIGSNDLNQLGLWPNTYPCSYTSHRYDAENEVWELYSSGTINSGKLGTGAASTLGAVGVGGDSSTWANYPVLTYDGIVCCGNEPAVPETNATYTYAPSSPESMYTVDGDTVTSLGATVYQITGVQATTTQEMIDALYFYAAARGEETTE